MATKILTFHHPTRERIQRTLYLERNPRGSRTYEMIVAPHLTLEAFKLALAASKEFYDQAGKRWFPHETYILVTSDGDWLVFEADQGSCHMGAASCLDPEIKETLLATLAPS